MMIKSGHTRSERSEWKEVETDTEKKQQQSRKQEQSEKKDIVTLSRRHEQLVFGLARFDALL